MMVCNESNTNRECSFFWGARNTWLRHRHPFYPILSYRLGLTWHETSKKSRYGGDVRAGALSWV